MGSLSSPPGYGCRSASYLKCSAWHYEGRQHQSGACKGVRPLYTSPSSSRGRSASVGVHGEDQDMNRHARHIGPLFTVMVIAVVAATLVAQNLRPRGPYHIREYGPHAVWDAYILRRGWPFTWHERADIWETASQGTSPLRTSRAGFTINSPAMHWSNAQAWALVGNAVLGLLTLTTTAILTEYYRHYRTGPFQFSLRSLFIATAVVAMVMALIDNGIMRLSALLYPPLALALLSLPAVVGLILQQYIRRSDRRVSSLRSHFNASGEIVQSMATAAKESPSR